MRFNLCVPFAERSKVKQLDAKWDASLKTWFFEGEGEELPEGLKKYEERDILIEYDEKDECKKLFPSMKWDIENKIWCVSQDEYTKCLEWREINFKNKMKNKKK